MKRFIGLTWMGWSNLLFVQWLGMRLYRLEQDDGRVTEIGLEGWILPLVGWGKPCHLKSPLWRLRLR